MSVLLALVPILPFAGFLILALFGAWMGRKWAAEIGCGVVGFSALGALALLIMFLNDPPPTHLLSVQLWQWFDVDGFRPGVTLYLDALSLVMIMVVTWVGFFIHLYSAAFMAEEDGYSRFFAYLNLFVGSMLLLVLADNLLLLYLGWEGVGLCSYLLIGFWYREEQNVRAAMKAFVVTRIGDTALAVGLFFIYTQLGTLQIQPLMHNAEQHWPIGSGLAVTASALLLIGALGKSAQLPLQTWLPDAMAGPSPVSALIHAATMVTAGVYLIARTNVLFMRAPVVLHLVAVIGAVTLLVAGCSALAQKDLKRVLAYSTISQLGYMFLALGVGAWTAAIFHFLTHAFFKSLLFLAAGVVIISMHEEHDMFKMGGLRRHMPLVFWTFLIGAASLSALPLITAGFYSKEEILYAALNAADGRTLLFAAGLVGALLTALYTFRMIFLVFYGPEHGAPARRGSLLLHLPLVVLAVFALIAGFIELPGTLGGKPFLSTFLLTALPPTIMPDNASTERILQLVSSLLALAGIWLAYILYLPYLPALQRFWETRGGAAVYRFLLSGWGFDWLYDWLFVRPYCWIARINKNDFVDQCYSGLAWCCAELHLALRESENGRVRWYAAGIVFGAVIVIALVVFIT